MDHRPSGPEPEDRLPEHTRYPDLGCHVFPACLRCPLPRCIYDRPPAESGRRPNPERDAAIYQAYQESAARRARPSTTAIAARFDVSPRTVQRIIQKFGQKFGGLSAQD